MNGIHKFVVVVVVVVVGSTILELRLLGMPGRVKMVIFQRSISGQTKRVRDQRVSMEMHSASHSIGID